MAEDAPKRDRREFLSDAMRTTSVIALAGTGGFDPKDKHQVLKDEHGLKGARATAKSMLELARIMQAGKRA